MGETVERATFEEISGGVPLEGVIIRWRNCRVVMRRILRPDGEDDTVVFSLRRAHSWKRGSLASAVVAMSLEGAGAILAGMSMLLSPEEAQALMWEKSQQVQGVATRSGKYLRVVGVREAGSASAEATADGGGEGDLDPTGGHHE